MSNKFSDYLLELNRVYKTIIILLVDYFLLTFSFWISLSIRDNTVYVPTTEASILIYIGPFIALPIFYSFGLYLSLIRYSNYKSLIIIMQAVSLYTLIWFLIVLSVDIVSKPYDFLIINWLVSSYLIGAIRYLAQGILGSNKNNKNVLIFGAGSAGIQLESALTYNSQFTVKGFIDNDQGLQGQYISGKKVFSFSNIRQLIKKKGISEVFIAIPSLSRKQRNDLFRSLNKYQIII